MKRTSWLTYFTSAYGACWLILLIISLATMSRINTGIFGLVGFPVVAVIYATLRYTADSRALASESATGSLSPDFARFLADHPPLLGASPEQQAQAYGLWLWQQRRNPNPGQEP